MRFRSILSGTLAMLLLSGAGAWAQDSGGQGVFRLPKVDLPGVFGGGTRSEVQVAQAGDPRITALEEQIRQMNGTIEELNFQILQMQEQMRKMQEDNEFRFQELEQKKSDTGAKSGRVVAGADTQAAPDGTPAPSDGSGATTAGEPPRTFGTIVFDADGNVKGAGAGDQAAGGVQADETADDTTVAALPPAGDPEELYRNSYEFILSGDYKTAEAGFREHIDRYPADAKTADAHYWLGEALLGQQKYRDAAEIFLAANRNFPSSKKAPDMMLKLGVSLAGLNQRDLACATLGEIGKRYPNASAQFKQRVKQEQALASC
ncbi:MAG: tol-pal system protein YbgF [Rhizobiaceae bacterium]|nr:MAG: tol-pal system protein YbgF [Rhizobiaceae bacterium]CAG1009310.1 Cell division coordinator CpoB [Rhizobiaceae bacterium]